MSFTTDQESQLQTKPLLDPTPSDNDQATMMRGAMAQTFKSTAHLANHLPTGTVLAFQILAPIFTNLGSCDGSTRTMTAVLVAFCGISCFVLCFTDSFKDGSGTIRYGLATIKGMWVIDGSAPLDPIIAMGYRLKFIDFVHAFVSVSVFGAVALFNQNVVSCFHPIPTSEAKRMLTILPIGIGVIGSGVFVTFPTTRHGIGFPLSH